MTPLIKATMDCDRHWRPNLTVNQAPSGIRGSNPWQSTILKMSSHHGRITLASHFFKISFEINDLKVVA